MTRADIDHNSVPSTPNNVALERGAQNNQSND